MLFGCEFLEFSVFRRKIGEGNVWSVQVFWSGGAYIGLSLSFTGVRFIVQVPHFVKTFCSFNETGQSCRRRINTKNFDVEGIWEVLAKGVHLGCII